MSALLFYPSTVWVRQGSDSKVYCCRYQKWHCEQWFHCWTYQEGESIPIGCFRLWTLSYQKQRSARELLHSICHWLHLRTEYFPLPADCIDIFSLLIWFRLLCSTDVQGYERRSSLSSGTPIQPDGDIHATDAFRVHSEAAQSVRSGSFRTCSRFPVVFSTCSNRNDSTPLSGTRNPQDISFSTLLLLRILSFASNVFPVCTNSFHPISFF